MPGQQVKDNNMVSGATGAVIGSGIAANTAAGVLRKLFAVIMIVADVHMMFKG